MSPQDNQFWEKIRRHEFDDPQAAFSFSDRLAKENGWSLEYAIGAIEEYKKFMFLICASDRTLTPSDAVDQVWHLHLLYTESYWLKWCDGVLNKKIHHGPTKGGNQEREKFIQQYEQTLAMYQRYFGTAAPLRYWPSSDERFAPSKHRRIDLKKYWMIKKPPFL